MIKPKPDVLPYRFASIAILTTSHFHIILACINRTPAPNWNIYTNLWLDVFMQFSSEFGSISFLYGYAIFYAIPKRINAFSLFFCDFFACIQQCNLRCKFVMVSWRCIHCMRCAHPQYNSSSNKKTVCVNKWHQFIQQSKAHNDHCTYVNMYEMHT